MKWLANGECNYVHHNVDNLFSILELLIIDQKLIAVIAKTKSAHCISYNKTLGSRPSITAFKCKLKLDILITTNFTSIHDKYQHLIRNHLIRTNQWQFFYDYIEQTHVSELFEIGKVKIKFLDH